jgi:hypothetical protein
LSTSSEDEADGGRNVDVGVREPEGECEDECEDECEGESEDDVLEESRVAPLASDASDTSTTVFEGDEGSAPIPPHDHRPELEGARPLGPHSLYYLAATGSEVTYVEEIEQVWKVR